MRIGDLLGVCVMFDVCMVDVDDVDVGGCIVLYFVVGFGCEYVVCELFDWGVVLETRDDWGKALVDFAM